MIPSIEVQLTDPTHTSEVRRAALRLSRQLGFDEAGQGRLALVVTEIATNIMKHARSGRVILTPLGQPGAAGIDVFGMDSGSGMSNFAECLRDGFSTAGSGGTGLGAIVRQSDEYDVYTVPSKGTIIRARCLVDKTRPVPPAPFEVAGIVLPLTGFTESGDAWALRFDGNGLMLLVVDGLGHGPEAAEAANAATSVFHAKPELTGERLFEEIHLALRHTRGAAAALAEIAPGSDQLSFIGVGNIAGIIYGEAASQHLLSSNGIVGHRMGRLKRFQHAWQPNSILILHSDGVRSRWKLEDYNGLRAKSVALIADVLLRDAGRGTDDAAVVVVRAQGVTHGA